jgi:hypothetical protein
MRQAKALTFLATVAAMAGVLLAASGGASSYPASSPEGRLAATRAELIALRGSIVLPVSRLWLSRAVASLGWAIDADCWSDDGSSLSSVKGGRCLDAIRAAVNRLAMGDQVDRVSQGLKWETYPQILAIVQIVRDIAIGSLNDASSAPNPDKALLWKAQHDIYALGDHDDFDPRWSMGHYLRAWHRLNGDTFTPVRITAGAELVQPRVDFNPAGAAEAFEITATGDTLSRINLYVDPASTATSLVAGVYADGEGGPGQLLAQGSTPLAQGGGEWNTVHVPRTAVTPGETYWIAIVTPAGGGTIKFRDRCCGGRGTSRSVMSQAAGLAALPATWSSGRQFTDGPLSVFGAD